MKILMATPSYYPVLGGTESFIESLSLKLNQRGIYTDILTFNFKAGSRQINEEITPVWASERQKINGINIIRIPCLKGIKPFKLLGLGWLPGRFANHFKKYDVIHFHNESSLELPLFSYHVKKPKIMHCHCLDESYLYYRKNIISRTIFRNIADIYIAVSNPIRDLLLNLGIPDFNIRIVYNAVDVEKFQPLPENKAKNLLLFVGRLQRKKGLHILLKSLEYLTTPVEVIIIGPLSKYDPEYNATVFTLIDNVNKKKIHKVIYLGVQKVEEIIKWYQKATIFICPSFSEPFGIVNLEALSCGTPVVASKVGGIPEVVRNNENGFLVQAGNPKQLAEAVQNLLDNEKLRKIFGEKGRQRVVRYFSQETVSRIICEIYDDLQ